ncbi:MAG: 50S ribosomal protein L4 [Nanoarchaeota archaeon]|nr:50S ribosomal protein L4 [Nanoarchaeota archaeon]
MKAQILSCDGKSNGSMELPKFFGEKAREDMVVKVFLANPERQPYGSNPRAGMEHSAHGIFKHRRRAWKGSYGIGIARTPSTVMSRKGTRFTRRGAFAANARGGRESHPPKTFKAWGGEINRKEVAVALMSAMILNNSMDVLKKNYPKTDFSGLSFPVIIEDKVVEIKKINEMKKAMAGALGKAADLLKKNIILVSEKKIAKGIGFDVKKSSELNIRDLVVSGKPGRFMIFTESSMKALGAK